MAEHRLKKYPRGPRLGVTKEWKARVLEELALNAEAGRVPANPTDLARLIGADKAGVHKLLFGEQQASKYMRAISQIMRINEAYEPVVDDEWAGLIAELRAQPQEVQQHALQVLRTFVKRLDNK
jgi:hypothetical protein